MLVTRSRNPVNKGMSSRSSPSRLLAFMLCILLAVPFYAVPPVAAASDEAVVVTGVEEWSTPQTIVGPVPYWTSAPSIVVDSRGVWHAVYGWNDGWWDEDGGLNEPSYITYVNALGETYHLVAVDYPYSVAEPALAIGPNDELHLAYFMTEGVNRMHTIEHMTDASGAWSTPQTVVDDAWSDLSIAVDSQGTWHLAYVHASGNPWEDEGYYAGYVNSLGNAYTLPVGGDIATRPRIAVGPDDELHIIYRAGSHSADGSLKYMSTVSGTWTSPQTVVAAVPVGYWDNSHSVSVDSEGVWHLVYGWWVHHGTEGLSRTDYVTYANALGSHYDLAVGSESDWALRPSIAVGPDDSLHVAYRGYLGSIEYMSRSGTPQQPAGEVEECFGDVEVSDEPVNPGDQIYADEDISVGDDGFIEIALSIEDGDAAVQAGSDSEFVLKGETAQDVTGIELYKGQLKSIVRSLPEGSSLEVSTPFLSGAVRGTEFITQVDENQTIVTVLDGAVEVSTPDGSQSTLVSAGTALSATSEGLGEPYPVDPDDVDAWWETSAAHWELASSAAPAGDVYYAAWSATDQGPWYEIALDQDAADPDLWTAQSTFFNDRDLYYRFYDDVWDTGVLGPEVLEQDPTPIRFERYPYASVTPAEVHFGDVAVGSVATSVVTVQNTGIAPLEVTDAHLTSADGLSLTAPSLPVTLDTDGYIELTVTFSPTATGPLSAALTVSSNDPDTPEFIVPITGTATEVVQPPDDCIQELLDFYDAALDTGMLYGIGPGRSASGRAAALRNMIEAAGDLITAGETELAIQQLHDVAKRCDADPTPPDFVDGPARTELHSKVLAVIAQLE